MSNEPDIDHQTVARSLELEGKRVVDIGCGKGGLVRFLRAQGAQVTGIECGEQQIAAAREADPEHLHDYLEGVAEELPMADASTDIAIFFYSLHHVPETSMVRALREVWRALIPGGKVYVNEPVATGDGFEVDRLIDDETHVRALAQEALAKASDVGFIELSAFEYTSDYAYDDFEDYVRSMVSVDPARRARFDAIRGEVEQAFAKAGDRSNGNVRFEQLNQVVILQKPEG